MITKTVKTLLNIYLLLFLKLKPSATPGLLYQIMPIFFLEADLEALPLEIEKRYIIGKGRQKERVQARDLLCYWAVAELGMSMVDLAMKFDITPAAVSYAVQRGEKIAKECGYKLEV